MTATTITPAAAAPRSHRASPIKLARNSFTLAWRNLEQLRSNPAEIVGFALLQPLMMTVILVYVFGGAISGSSKNYLQYALPGLIVQGAVFSTLSVGASLHQDIANGVFDRLRSLPIARSAPLIGHLLGNQTRFVIGMLMLLGIGSLQGFDIRTGPLDVLGGLVLTAVFSIGLAWMSMMVGLKAGSAATVYVFNGVLTFPLTFGSNVFVSTSTMPGWLQPWANANPISHLATALRALLSGGPATSPVLWTLGWSIGLTAAFMPPAVQAYRHRA